MARKLGVVVQRLWADLPRRLSDDDRPRAKDAAAVARFSNLNALTAG
jgi:hypothetical protein